MFIIIIIALIILALALAGIGAWIVIKDDKAESDAPVYAPIDRSGKYSVLRKTFRVEMLDVKPNPTQLEEWLKADGASEAQVQELLVQWQDAIQHVVQTIEKADVENVVTFTVLQGVKDKDFCNFLPSDNYLTREQIMNHPELLPPYYPGCGCRLNLKRPWENASKSGWKPIVPGQDGKYAIPNWKHRP